MKIRISGRKLTILVLALLTTALAMPYATAQYQDITHNRQINTEAYKSKYGHWDDVVLPDGMRVNAVHAALLSTGKILIVAGSGNDQATFDAGTFKSLLYDPKTGSAKLIYTPTDLFCAGHSFLPNGNLLIAGGTERYEKLAATVNHAAGIMTVKNEDPNGADRVMPKGTVFIGPNGQRYDTDVPLVLHPAMKMDHGKGKVKVTASETTITVYAEAVGKVAVTASPAKYAIQGLVGDDIHNIYGQGDLMTLKKQDFQGNNKTYFFDARSEQYIAKPDMNYKRWYPTLVGLTSGDILASSGLDGNGQILEGQTEIWSVKLNKWIDRDDLEQYFPTYPALFQTAVPDVLFYSGSNAGYGPATRGRKPAFWNLSTNQLKYVGGLRDPALMETSGSAWAGTVQNQTVMVVGGGGVGESPASTGRIDLIKLNAKRPHYTPGPSLPQGTRYPGLVTLPDDTTLITGGSSNYRGRHLSDNHTAMIYDPSSRLLTRAADPTVGRDYHSEALLLPDGRVITLGSNPLFSDKIDTQTAPFEQRIVIYTPPYLYHGARPIITAAPSAVKRGQIFTVATPDATNITKARLIRPSAVTHVTDLEQRSVAMDFAITRGALRLKVPKSSAIVPPGYYMLFLDNKVGVPSIAKWIQVS